jgi:hypothetical protein
LFCALELEFGSPLASAFIANPTLRMSKVLRGSSVPYASAPGCGWLEPASPDDSSLDLVTIAASSPQPVANARGSDSVDKSFVRQGSGWHTQKT